MTEYQEDKVLDARGLLCPMPVVKAGKEIRGMEDGEILKINDLAHLLFRQR